MSHPLLMHLFSTPYTFRWRSYIFTVSQRRIPNVDRLQLKKQYQISTAFGMNNPDSIPGCQMTAQVLTSPYVCRTNEICVCVNLRQSVTRTKRLSLVFNAVCIPLSKLVAYAWLWCFIITLHSMFWFSTIFSWCVANFNYFVFVIV